MAVITAFDSAINMAGHNDYVYGTVYSSGPNHISVVSGARDATYYGSFTHVGGEVEGGTVTSYALKTNNILTYSAQKLSITVALLEQYLIPDNYNGLIQYLLRGADTISGSIGNDTLIGLDGNDIIDGYWGNDWIEGGTGNDVLYGNQGNDTLVGGAGADTMAGGKGDDYYFVDHTSDIIVELANEGHDFVRSSVTYVLSAHIEHLVLVGTGDLRAAGNAQNNLIEGNSGHNRLDGGQGMDTLTGRGGNDTYYVDNLGDVVIEQANEGTDQIFSTVSYILPNEVEYLTLLGGSRINASGNALNNRLIGNDSHNLIDGSTGADTMAGGLGNDVYYVDDAGDLVVENANEGKDTVVTDISYQLTANVEVLSMTGSGNVWGTGNALDNLIAGTSGNNRLDGGAGADTLMGGEGDDLYIVDNLGDVIFEHANQGTDTLISRVNWVLDENLEHLTLAGAGNLNGTGNDRGNHIIGTIGNNILNGGLGADTLTGGQGTDVLMGGVDAHEDVFVFNSVQDSGIGAQRDIIVDFASGTDLIDLSGIDADTGLSGHQLFTFIDRSAFSGSAGELRYYNHSKHVVLAGDVNGDGLADFEIQIQNTTSLTPFDFV